MGSRDGWGDALMYCAACDRWEHSDLGLDTETCMKCGGYLCQPDDDDEGDALLATDPGGQL